MPKLLQRVCEDAKAEGFVVVESYPNKQFIDVARDFTGPSAMYEKMGFTEYKKLSRERVIMRRELT